MTDDELNALAAEKVMGWERREHVAPPADFPAPSRFHSGLQWWKNGERQACAECGDLPDPLHSIADAMRLVEKLLEEDDVYFSVQGYGPTKQWYVEIGDGPITAFHPDLSRAITLACLKAVGAIE